MDNNNPLNCIICHDQSRGSDMFCWLSTFRRRVHLKGDSLSLQANQDGVAEHWNQHKSAQDEGSTASGTELCPMSYLSCDSIFRSSGNKSHVSHSEDHIFGTKHGTLSHFFLASVQKSKGSFGKKAKWTFFPQFCQEFGKQWIKGSPDIQQNNYQILAENQGLKLVHVTRRKSTY